MPFPRALCFPQSISSLRTWKKKQLSHLSPKGKKQSKILKPMKTRNKPICMILAWLGGACLIASQVTAGQLIGTVTQISPATPQYSATNDLTAEGTADWIFWEETHATPTGVFDHKASGPEINSISDLSVYGAVGPYYDSLGFPSFSWSDGSPNNPSTTGMANCFANGPAGNGLQFTVKADTRTKYLKVYFGGYSGTAACMATLSDNSAPPITLTVDDSGDYNASDSATIQFSASSNSVTLTVAVYVSETGVDGDFTTAGLSAATLQAPPPPPTISVQPASQTNFLTQTAQLNVVAVGGLPLSYQWFQQANSTYAALVDGARISGSTNSTLTISNLGPTDATNYYVVVSNSYGAPVTSSVANLTIKTQTSALIGSSASALPNIDLTAAGDLDWAHWGLVDVTSLDQKAAVVNKIGTFSTYGDPASGPNQNGGAPITASWSDGAPDSTAAHTPTGIWWGGVNNGFQFSVAASTDSQVLTVYVDEYSGRLHFEAGLSDSSAPTYVDESVTTIAYNQVAMAYTIEFAASTPGQTLNILAYSLLDNGGGGHTELMSATLQTPQPKITAQPVSNTNSVTTTALLTASAGGWLPLSYQWFAETNGVYVPLAEGGQISGSASNTLTVANLTPANGTNYYVVITNVYGAVTSSVATLTVVPISGTLIGMALPAPAMVDLTALGTLDWADWGLNLATDFDQKEGGTNQISNITLIGPGPNGPIRYDNALAAFSWSDGTPDSTAADTTTGIYFNDLNNGYQITVPADRTARILTVYAGGYNTTVHFEATLSDSSAPPFVDASLVTPNSAALMAAYTIAYVAGAPNQTLTINVTCATAGGNVTLMAATLNGPKPLIAAPPASSTNWLGQTQQFSVSAGGWPTLAYQWWGEANGVYAPLADGAQISGSTTPTLTIDNVVSANATNYYVVITNAYGAVTSSVANLAVLPVTGTMQATVDLNIPSGTVVDLTAEGTLDWANWGLADLGDFNDKAVGGGPVGLIGNWTLYGSGTPTLDNFSDQPYGFSWTDGTPTAAVSTTGFGTANYIYVGSLGAGFQITLPADTIGKVLKLHYGGYGCRTRVMATLSDNSAPPFINDSVNDPGGNIAYGIATIYFAAHSTAQTLTVTVYDFEDYLGGNVAISAATLTSPKPINVTISRSGSSPQLAWPYGTLLQATNVMGPWSVSGHASPYTVTPTEPQMFYRIQVQ